VLILSCRMGLERLSATPVKMLVENMWRARRHRGVLGVHIKRDERVGSPGWVEEKGCMWSP